MLDEEFNTITHSLPFLFKKDKQQFFAIVDEIDTNELTEFQAISMTYTLHAMGIHTLWFNFFVRIVDRLQLEHKLNLIKFVSGYVETPTDIDVMKKIYTDTFEQVNNDENVVFECSFLNSRYFKPLLGSNLKTMRNVQPELFSYIVDQCLSRITSITKKLTCYERLVQLRQLSDDEIADLADILVHHPEYSGRVIDVYLRTCKPELITKAREIIKQSDMNTTNQYTSPNAVHYFEISPYWLDIMKDYSGLTFNDALAEMLDMARVICEKVEPIYNVANLLLCSFYTYQSVSLEKIFTYCWSICNYDNKCALINDLVEFDTDLTCSYGLMINTLCLVGALTQRSFLITNSQLAECDSRLDKLKQLYPSNDDLWTDAEQVAKMLETLTVEVSQPLPV